MKPAIEVLQRSLKNLDEEIVILSGDIDRAKQNMEKWTKRLAEYKDEKKELEKAIKILNGETV